MLLKKDKEELFEECTICGKKEATLTAMRGYDGDEEMCCKECVGHWELWADMEYERQKEEMEDDERA